MNSLVSEYENIVELGVFSKEEKISAVDSIFDLFHQKFFDRQIAIDRCR
jgi:hypothetical protein